MFDASYFKTGLQNHLAATKSTVEVHLANAHTHRVRAVVDANDAYVTFEAFRQRIDGGRADQYWNAEPSSDHATNELVRVVVAYEAIAEIVITPVEDAATPRIGFVRP